MSKRKHRLWSFIIILAVILLAGLWFHLLYRFDNKYTSGPPYGEKGVLTFSAEDLDRPLFLIDGWEFYPDRQYRPEDFLTETADREYLFIGQYSNFSYIKNGHSPFGQATYRLRLFLQTGEPPCALTLEIPEIFTDYTLWIDGLPVASTDPDAVTGFNSGGRTGSVSFILDGSAELVLNVENYTHYYSGLYHPPALGRPEVITRMLAIRTLFYTLLFAVPFTLTVFFSVLWVLRDREPLFFHFGLLCLFFAVMCLHPLVRLAAGTGRVWYAIEDAARIAMLTETARIAALVSGFIHSRRCRMALCWALPGLCLVSFVSVLLIIPEYGAFIRLYGAFVDTCFAVGWLWLCICAAKGFREQAEGGGFILAGSCLQGMGFFINLLNNNRFEPIYTGWQTEYTGFFMVLLFGGLMVQKNHRILVQNRQLVFHMEDLVQKRTAELHSILEERKNFFSDMAHNLKAPIAAVHGFINLIREENLYLDEELNEYISLIENENDEIRQRVQTLNTLNAFDRIQEAAGLLDLSELLNEVSRNNEPDAGAMGIHLIISPPDTPVCIRGQKEKLLILFENLIYNAIAFTPAGGFITITAEISDDTARIRVADTGSGISPEHLPRIFERFYVGRDNPSEGSGLGLYIARLTVEEMGGTIEAESEVGKGTVFIIRLPPALKE